MGKSCTGKTAVGLTIVSFVLILVAFTTPNWLQTNGKLEKPKFKKIGLWQVCFNGFQDIQHLYDNSFYGCWWLFGEEYYIIRDLFLPAFFVETQIFFTLCLTLLLIGSFLTALYTRCSSRLNKYQLLLWTTGANSTLAAICGIIAVLIFGAKGDSRHWMPNWEHNDLSWSYALAVVGSLSLLAAGILFLVEAKRFRRKSHNFDYIDKQKHLRI